jgi:hypothetical protein
MRIKMRIIYAEYNMYHNSIDITTYVGFDTPFEYARLYLDGTMQMWVDAEDSLGLW